MGTAGKNSLKNKSKENFMEENVRKNDFRAIKIDSREDGIKGESISPNSLQRVSVLNLTDKAIADKISWQVCEYKCLRETKTFCDDEILKDTSLLCIMYVDKVDIAKNEITQLIKKARENNVDIYMLCIKDKSIDDVISTINEIAHILCGVADINMNTKELKGEDILDAFVVTQRNGMDIQEEYIKTFEKCLSKISNLSQVGICVYCGNNTKLCDLLYFIDLQNKLTKGVDIIFGSDIEEIYSGVCKVVVIFQGGGQKTYKKQMLEEKIEYAHQNYQKEKTETKQTKDIYDKQFYKSQIKRFCKLKDVSISIVQRFFTLGYPKAARIIDEWNQKGYIEKNDYNYKIIDSKSIMKSLNGMFD